MRAARASIDVDREALDRERREFVSEQQGVLDAMRKLPEVIKGYVMRRGQLSDKTKANICAAINDAVATFVRDEAAGTTRPRSESIEGRLDDLINYCLLAKAMIIEEEELRIRRQLDNQRGGK